MIKKYWCNFSFRFKTACPNSTLLLTSLHLGCEQVLFSTNARILDFRSNKKERGQKQTKKIKFEVEKNKVSTLERSSTKTYEVKVELNPEQTSRREFLFSTYARKIKEKPDNYLFEESNEYFSYESVED